MEKRNSNLHAEADAAMTRWQRSPENQDLQTTYRKAREVLDMWYNERKYKMEIFFEAHLIAAGECNPLLT